MIIKELVLNNFRVFKGQHTIDLMPRKKKYDDFPRPIVLFGGLNGTGKTTILSAIRLALYGKLSFENSSQKEYLNHLDNYIYSGPGDLGKASHASVELVFTYNKDGFESEFKIIREWKKGHKDTLKLMQDDRDIQGLSYEQCQGFLNELIPSGIADLFFFDGEKISELAEDSSGKILRTAVRRLLGLDLISKLKNDLVIFLKQQNEENLDSEEQAKIDEYKNIILALSKESEKTLEKADFTKNKITFIQRDIINLENMLNAEGGAFAKTKSYEQSKVDSLIKEKEQTEKQIKNVIDGVFPYSLAINTLQRLLKKISLELEIKKALVFENELNEFLDLLKNDIALRSSTTSKIATEAITDNLKDYMKTKPKGDLLFDITERESGIIQKAIDDDSRKSRSFFESLRDRLIDIEQQLELAAENIARAPEDDQLLRIFEKIRGLDNEKHKLAIEYKELLEQATVIKQKQLEYVKKVQKTHDSIRTKHTHSNAQKNAYEAIKLLDKYSDALTESRVEDLARNFEIAYRNLSRKEDQQIKANINPKTFDVELVNEQGIVINRKLLSAGEKQIYAIAILEALAKTSGRELPVIIDTPLGRLDSKHRDKLINNYFPHASHQVILLSTDTEVDQRYFVDQLRDDISHAYEIIFNSLDKSSKLKSGYFWELTKETV